MVFEDVKRLLNEYKGYKKQLKSEQLRVQELRASLPSVKAVDYGAIRVSCGNNRSEYVEKILDRISVLEARCNELMQKVFDIEDLIANSMESLTPLEQAMITDRYLHGWSWKKIAREYHYSEGEPYYIVNKAIKKMSEK
jgi:hypothetical protein